MAVADSFSEPEVQGQPALAPYEVYQEVFQALSTIGIVSYGTAWLISWSMFARINLRPEDVGINYEFLAVRSIYIAGALILLVGGLVLPSAHGHWLRRGRQGSLRAFHRVFLSEAVVFLVLSTVAAFMLGRCVSNTFDKQWMDHWLVALVMLPLVIGVNYAQGALVLRAVDYEVDHVEGPGLGPEVRGNCFILVTTMWLFTFAVLALGVGATLGYRIVRHQPAEFFFNVHSVQVRQLGSSDGVASPTDPITCGLVLGYDGGLVRIYSDEDEVVAFPIESVSVTDMDKESCHRARHAATR